MTEIEFLRSENANLKRLLAQSIAESVWVNGGSFGKINMEIAAYGYKLDNLQSGLPRLVPIATKAAAILPHEADAPRSTLPKEKVFDMTSKGKVW